MVAFPIKGLKISTDSNNVITVSMTDAPVSEGEADGFKYYAHSRGTTVKDKFYIGAYEGYKDDNDRLRSLSGKANSAISIHYGLIYARNNSPASDGNGGSGYDPFAFYQLTFIQAMYILKYKNLNSQAVIGRGYVSGYTGTGNTNDKGMFYGSTTEYQIQVKCFGIEDLWGKSYDAISGIGTKNKRLYVATQGFNDTGEGYSDTGVDVISTGWVYFSKTVGTTELGFIPKPVSEALNGSSSTYYGDLVIYSSDNAWHPGQHGGSGYNGNGSENSYTYYSGLFCFTLDGSINETGGNAFVTSRIMYL